MKTPTHGLSPAAHSRSSQPKRTHRWPDVHAAERSAAVGRSEPRCPRRCRRTHAHRAEWRKPDPRGCIWYGPVCVTVYRDAAVEAEDQRRPALQRKEGVSEGDGILQ